MFPPLSWSPLPSCNTSTPATARAIASSLRQVGASPINSIEPAAVTAGVVLMTIAPTTPGIIRMP
jgi:stage V sporulation protein SpoVS